MAKNLKYEDGRYIHNQAATDPAAPASGDPALINQIPCVALTNEGEGGNDAGKSSFDTKGVYDLSVKGENAGGNVAVAFGDKLYYESGETPVLNKDATNGVFYGYAWGVVSSGATATIPVKIGE